jgi:hypothetical protein
MNEPRYIFGVGIPDERPPDPLAPQELADAIRDDLNALHAAFERGTAYDQLDANLGQVIERATTRLTFLVDQAER